MMFVAMPNMDLLRLARISRVAFEKLTERRCAA
jgi:hypothetical protein